jgi:DeoR/GlpR family transcriptional regulator of sugar metabolism
LGKSNPVERTSERLAKEYGVSEKTIRNDAKFAEAVSSLSRGLINGHH